MFPPLLLFLLSVSDSVLARNIADRSRPYHWQLQSPHPRDSGPASKRDEIHWFSDADDDDRFDDHDDYADSDAYDEPMTTQVPGPPVLVDGVSPTASITAIPAASSSTAPASPTSTQLATPAANITLCNGHAEFCNRRYSNISMVGAHNSPFVLSNNLAANQAFHVTQQLDDGIRFVQGQMQWPVNGTVPHFCHTSCDLLDAGPIASWLGDVRQWVEGHPNDVVTILLGNGNYSTPDLYAPFIESTGIHKYAFVPPISGQMRMSLEDWPTLGEMIRDNKRVVMMLDYKANQTAYPWLLDEFSYLWETPFDPILPVEVDIDTGNAIGASNSNLPCTVQRPPDLADGDARNGLYLMNHNLNVEVTVLDNKFSVPALSLANKTNSMTGSNSLGTAAQACYSAWGRPPLVLNVDYYNYGTPPGSVFHVAAGWNGVTYNGTCCGLTAGVRSSGVRGDASILLMAFAVLLVGACMW